MSVHPKNNKRDHYNSEQYMYDLISVISDPEIRAKLSAIMGDISDIEYEEADAKYRGRKYPEKALKFYMTSRNPQYLIDLSGDAVKIFHWLATYMSQNNLCIAPTKTLSEILDIKRSNVERAIKELRDHDMLAVTGYWYKRSQIYEVNQDFVSYGVRPQGYQVIKDYVPVLGKVFIETNDPKKPKVLYVGDVQKIQPKNVVSYDSHKKRSETDSEALNESVDIKPQMTVEELLEGLI